MSHSTVLVIGPTNDDDLAKALAPFDECSESERVEVVETDGETYWINPRAKWDWWTLGGRWAGSLVVHGGAIVDRARWGDLDWERIGQKRVAERRDTYGRALADDERHREFMYGVKEGESEDDYIRRTAPFTTFAILTPDGEWFERGRMVWFGVALDEKEPHDWKREWHLICDHYCNDDTVVSVVDVHI